MDADFSEVRQLEADLRAAPPAARPYVRKAIEITARRVKDQWREKANRTGLHKYAFDVTYDMEDTADGIGAEIGPTIGDSGSLGFVEEGGGGVRSAPQHAARDALEANEQDFVDGLEKALLDGLSDALGV